MKIKGMTPGKCVEVVPIIRGDNVMNIVVEPVSDWTPFETSFPKPEPTRFRVEPGGIKKPDPEDKEYAELCTLRLEYKWYWMILKSLEKTEDLVWDTVDITDPQTWKNVDKELVDAGLTIGEIAELVDAVTHVNGLNDDRIREARENFYRMKQVAPV